LWLGGLKEQWGRVGWEKRGDGREHGITYFLGLWI
jgi:hypothetical protein